MNKESKAFIIAAPSSGSGKTTLTMGIIAALRRRGLSVQPFKTGPDYIDSAYHSALAGRPCINLDTWMTDPNFVQETFRFHSAGADIAIVEGVMGLFDGMDERGSTAHIAKLLGLPVTLVVDAKKSAQSAAAMLYGFENFDPNVNVSTVIFNRIAGSNHWNSIATAMKGRCQARPLGYLPKNPKLTLPERQLGLVSAHEHGLPEEYIGKLIATIEANIDLDQLVESALPLETGNQSHPKATAPVARLGIARDEAFFFYYEDNLRLLENAGIEPVPFSPLHDKELPENIGGLYFGGGFPEEFAVRLAKNHSMLNAVRRFNGKIIAECGGLIYLCKTFIAHDGTEFQLTGLIDGKIGMTGQLQACGYREVKTSCPTPIGPADTILRGHEFHWSDWIEKPAEYGALKTGDRCRGIANEKLIASYFHMHFGSNPKAVTHLKESLKNS